MASEKVLISASKEIILDSMKEVVRVSESKISPSAKKIQTTMQQNKLAAHKARIVAGLCTDLDYTTEGKEILDIINAAISTCEDIVKSIID